MNPNNPQETIDINQVPDLSKPWVLHVKDVANMLRITEDAVRMRVKRGTLAVKPRDSKRNHKLEWSSLDWWKWFNSRK